MTLKEISYELLSLIRGGYVSDDERIDLRLLEEVIRQYRVDYIDEINRVQKTIPESFIQTINIPLSITEKATYNILESTNNLPKIVIGRYGPMISEIYSPYVDEYSFTIVNRSRFRYSGNGKFNSDIIFVTYSDDKLKFKSENPGYINITDVNVPLVLENPLDDPNFDIDTDEYPMDSKAIPYIKKSLKINEIALLLGQYSDEVNDASGEIKE